MKKILIIIMWLLLSFSLNSEAKGLEAIRFIHSDQYVLPYKYAFQLFNFSEQHDVDVQHLQAWILKESSGNEKAFNRRTKDFGLCQIHDVDYLKQKYWKEDTSFNVWNGKHNLKLALHYLNDLILEFGIRKGFMAYNIGPTRLRAGRILEVGKKYVAAIFGEKEVVAHHSPSSLSSSFPVHSFSRKEVLLFVVRKKSILEEIAT